MHAYHTTILRLAGAFAFAALLAALVVPGAQSRPMPDGPYTTSVYALTDGRSPDTSDAAVLAHTPAPAASVAPTASPGFDWSDFTVGAAAALGAMALLIGLGAAARSGRGKRPGSIRTA